LKHFTKISIDNGEGLQLYNENCDDYLNNFCSYTIDAELDSGIHSIEFENTGGGDIFLDKFRIFSDTNQDFTDILEYKLPETETPDLFCLNGILKNNICCLSSCGQCGGTGCGTREGGSGGCCGNSILNSGRTCDVNSAPCIVLDSEEEIIPDPNCERGQLKEDICYHSTCIKLGGSGCGDASNGGGDNCCSGSILSSGRTCDIYDAPCYIEPVVEEQIPDITCINGIIKNNICCLNTCLNDSGEPQCGGSGCGTREGGGSGCCSGVIEESQKSCNDFSAPCVIGL